MTLLSHEFGLKSPDPDIFLPWELLRFKFRTNRCKGGSIPLVSIAAQPQGRNVYQKCLKAAAAQAATGASGERETLAAFAIAGRFQSRNFI